MFSENEIYVQAGYDWLEQNTTLIFDRNDPESLPNCAKLFIIKFVEIMQRPEGVSQESLEGLSISYAGQAGSQTMSADILLRNLANTLLSQYIKTAVKVFLAVPRGGV